MTSRRTFLGEAAAVAVSLLAVSQARGQGDARGQTGSGNLFAGMDPSRAKDVRLPPKPNARPLLTPDERDVLEHRLHCQCGTCTLDVYTCRTTDFSCQVSPAMHRDVVALVEGGYSGDEIIRAFVNSYGERVLMAPPAKGFNLLGYVAPFAALTAGAAVLVVLLRRWSARAHATAMATPSSPDAAPARLGDDARLEAAIRNDG